jgi:hypothetical protein
MKKGLLFTVAFAVGIGASAQNRYTLSGNPIQKIDKNLANRAAPYDFNRNVAGETQSFQSLVQSLKPKDSEQQKIVLTNTTIGSSFYDLQTNASIPGRVILNPDGTISATWTFATSNPGGGTPERGTGYTYFNGTAWSAAPTTRLESVRTGWPNIGVTAGGKEIVIGHLADGTAHDLIMMSRPTKGTGAWTQTSLGIPDSWPRMVVGGSNGQTVHVISQSKGAAPENPDYMGMDAAATYSRSLDGGVTWDKVRTVIPQIDATQYFHFGGDNYNLAAKGDTIAIVLGGLDVDVILLKSTDNGDSWTKTIVSQFAIPMFDPYTMISDADGDGVADTLDTNDGSVNVLLDNSGKAHVFFGAMRMLQETPSTTGGVSFFPGVDGLMYWNENMGSAAPVMIAAAMDINGDGVLNIGTPPAGTWPFGTYYVSLTSMASPSIDAMGRIYVSYSSIYEGLSDDGTVAGGKSYRHQYIIRSDDNGATWCNPQDVSDPQGPTQQDFIEGVFGSLTPKTDGFVHLVWQKDAAPGHGLSGTPPGSTDAQSGPSDIIYTKIPVAEVACGASVAESSNDISMNVYPNPAENLVTVSFNLATKQDVTVNIYNVVGQIADSFNNNNSIGTTALNINLAGYKPGVYFVTATIGNKVYSQKLIVK